MPDFRIPVTRTAWADTTIEVADVDNLQQAEEKALDVAGSFDFREHASTYELTNGASVDQFTHLPAKRLYIEAYAPYASAGSQSPSPYLSVVVDAEFVRTASLLAELCVTHKLHSVETSSPSLYWGDKSAEQLRMGVPTLCVSANAFWFEASDRLNDGPVHSREVKIADLILAMKDSSLHAVFLGEQAVSVEEQVLENAEEQMLQTSRPSN